MAILETMAATATIASFVSSVTARGQSKTVSNNIRDTLRKARTDLSNILKSIEQFEEDLTSQEHEVYMNQWKFLDGEASKGLTQSNDNSFKRWMKRSRMRRAAHRLENEILDLKSNIEQSSMTARIDKSREPINQERKRKEIEIKHMKLEIEHEETREKLEDINRRRAESS